MFHFISMILFYLLLHRYFDQRKANIKQNGVIDAMKPYVDIIKNVIDSGEKLEDILAQGTTLAIKQL